MIWWTHVILGVPYSTCPPAALERVALSWQLDSERAWSHDQVYSLDLAGLARRLRDHPAGDDQTPWIAEFDSEYATLVGELNRRWTQNDRPKRLAPYFPSGLDLALTCDASTQGG